MQPFKANTVICISCERTTANFYPTPKGNLCRRCYETMAARQQRDSTGKINVLAGMFPWYWRECLWTNPDGRKQGRPRHTDGDATLRARLNDLFRTSKAKVLCTFVLACYLAYLEIP